MRYNQIYPLVHNIRNTLDYPPSYINRCILLYLPLKQEIEVVFYLISYDLSLCIQEHVNYAYGMLFNLFGLVWVQEFEDMRKDLLNLVKGFIFFFVRLRRFRESFHKK